MAIETISNPTVSAPIPQEMYLPLEIFNSEFFQDTSDLPYQATFSLEPLLKKWKANNQHSQTGVAAATAALIKEIELAVKKTNGSLEEIKKMPELQEAMTLLFPGFFFSGQIGFISVPFSKNFIFISPAFQEEISTGEWEVKIMNNNIGHASEKFTLEIASFILNEFYGQELDMCPRDIISLRHKKTGLERFYKINSVNDYVRVTPLKPLKPLSETQIQELFNNTENTELYLECFPPENFAFDGFFIGYLSDVTDVEALSNMKAKMVQEEGYVDWESQLRILNYLQLQIRSFSNAPTLKVGCFTLEIMYGGWKQQTNWSLFREVEGEYALSIFQKAHETYAKALFEHQTVIIDDLTKLSHPTLLEELLLQQGIRSLLLVPLYSSDGQFCGIFELGIEQTHYFSTVTIKELRDVIAHFARGVERSLREVQKQVISVMQEQFTAMHPSVAWKFQEAASKYLLDGQYKETGIEPIVFQDVYPLYGQADIVGSSVLRNQAIRTDLTNNLKEIRKVLKAFKKKSPFHLLDMHLLEVKKHLQRLEAGIFVSSDESQIVELLNKKIHPFLKHLVANHPQLPAQELQNYFNGLDANLNIVYCKRKEYEESVRLLNQTMSTYLETSDHKMQKVLPHFFEKYKTDGVEYNIYLGQSILQNQEFSKFYLQDFRLWQLIHMCEITRLIAQTVPELPIPLQTAQLIFVYNNSLSIRFRMDEKKFDVDGTYNVRYEILKKRIDKAIVKETGERLTQSGKIAIVWLQEKDRQEYMQYLSHLVSRGYIEDNIEDLELEKLQGAEGLRALRVTVIGGSIG